MIRPSPEQMIRPARPVVWAIALIVAVGMIGVGIWSYAHQVRDGFIITGLRNPGYGGAAWGFYIVFYIYFVGVSFAGITVSALARLFHVEALQPITRIAELLTITALIAGTCSILADLDRPLHGLLTLPNFARPKSPFYGTFTLVVAGYLGSSLVYLFLSARRDAAVMRTRGPKLLRWVYRLWATGHTGSVAERSRRGRAGLWLSVTILPLLVAVLTTEGFIFGIQSGRPGWYGALQAPAFVILAGVSGLGMLILVLLAVRKIFHLSEQIPARTIRWLGTFMSVLAMVYLYFMVVEELTATYAAPSAERHLAHVITAGPLAPMFWTTVACLFAAFAIPFVLWIRGRTSLAWLGAAALLANVGAVLKRMLIVVPSQTHGALFEVESGSYWPSLWEVGVVAGLFGIMFTGILSFGRFFPLTQTYAPLPNDNVEGADTRSRKILRLSATGLTVVLALLLIVFGLADSFRLFSGGELDPTVPYSPVIFAVGLMMLFGAAIVYETFPGSRVENAPAPEQENSETAPDSD